MVLTRRWGWGVGTVLVCATSAVAATVVLQLPLRPGFAEPTPPVAAGPDLTAALPPAPEAPDLSGLRPADAVETAALFVDVVHQRASFALRPALETQPAWIPAPEPVAPLAAIAATPAEPAGPASAILPPLRPSLLAGPSAIVPLPPPRREDALTAAAAPPSRFEPVERTEPEPAPAGGFFGGLLGRRDPGPDPADRSGRALQSGVASWYGPGFHGRKTASGEVFNQHSMTAAHRHLPFGTRVRVINESTGRSVVVRINDRGPFKHGRVIDLSKTAAQELGMGGLARVRLVSAE